MSNGLMRCSSGTSGISGAPLGEADEAWPSYGIHHFLEGVAPMCHPSYADTRTILCRALQDRHSRGCLPERQSSGGNSCCRPPRTKAGVGIGMFGVGLGWIWCRHGVIVRLSGNCCAIGSGVHLRPSPVDLGMNLTLIWSLSGLDPEPTRGRFGTDSGSTCFRRGGARAQASRASGRHHTALTRQSCATSAHSPPHQFGLEANPRVSI